MRKYGILGALVEDLFEIVSWYFPIELKQTSNNASITKELLTHGCVTCLTAHPEFAPFCYLLIEEKLNDEECSLEQKIETCELLVAASVFRPNSILSHLESILGDLRAVGLNPKCWSQLLCSFSIAHNLSKVYYDSFISMIFVFLHPQSFSDLEPFVLQVDMGLAERSLTLLRCASSAGPAIRGMIYDRVIPWIVMLVQGDVVNVRSNRPEIIEQGLQYISIWVEIIHDHGFDDVLVRFYSSVFASIDVARETAPNGALVALHNCLSVVFFLAY
uniref:MMS19 nucleotide excision repair protein n=1 Tax=Angiostrongylus cantonensis TaxID=6313 RepID=A0A0K0CUZ8_ANGCA